MSFTPDAIRQFLNRYPAAPHYWVALSGGVDSVVLLHALRQLGFPVRALHINHGLSASADHWQRFCESLCREWGVACYAERVAVVNGGGGIEEAARQARYRVFEQQLSVGDALLTAHHRDDQAETLLLRLMRGAGPKGLGAMAEVRPLGQGRLLRPLLGVSRQQLEAYARDHRLQWVEDESNRDTDFDRNFLRHEIMPLLEARWPEFGERWQQSAELCRDTQQLADILAEQDLQGADMRAERLGHSLALAPLQRLTPARRGQLLRLWLSRLGGDMPERAHLAEVEQQLIAPRPDSEAQVSWGNVCLRHFRGRLYRLPSRQQSSGKAGTEVALSWTTNNGLSLPDGGSLGAERLVADASDCLLRLSAQVQVRWRRGGERCKPVGRRHSQVLKKLLQEYELEPWLRNRVPLVYIDNQLAAVGDLWVCEGFQALPGEEGLALRWQLDSPS